jgi:hyperosmotically inducible protein
VKSKLAADTETSAIKIGVETREGIVTLSGTVPTDTEKTKAEQIARATEGVKRVANDIKVDPNSRSATNLGDKSGEAVKGVGETLSDAAILATLKAKLVADGITGTDVDVTRGEVILKGQVENASEKTKAETIAKNTAGVKDVKNQLTVKKLKGA